jgi:hypothetical protein
MLERASSYAGGHVGSGQAALELSAQVEGPRARAGDTRAAAAAAAAAAKTLAGAERRILPGKAAPSDATGVGECPERSLRRGFSAGHARRSS